MPKVVDHTARRERITEAVQRLVSTAGLDAVTVARAAAEAGISVGQLQHYFTSKEQLLEQTYRHVVARMRRRVERATDISEQQRLPIRDMVVTGLSERLPLDAARSADHQVALAFIGYTAANPALTQLHAETLTRLRGQLVSAIHNGKACGEVPADSDEDAHATRLLALTDGLALHCNAMPSYQPSQLLDILREQVTEVFSGSCRHWETERMATGVASQPPG
jgi:AcrR family transcriptional regulator